MGSPLTLPCTNLRCGSLLRGTASTSSASTRPPTGSRSPWPSFPRRCRAPGSSFGGGIRSSSRSCFRSPPFPGRASWTSSFGSAPRDRRSPWDSPAARSRAPRRRRADPSPAPRALADEGLHVVAGRCVARPLDGKRARLFERRAIRARLRLSGEAVLPRHAGTVCGAAEVPRLVRPSIFSSSALDGRLAARIPNHLFENAPTLLRPAIPGGRVLTGVDASASVDPIFVALCPLQAVARDSASTSYDPGSLCRS